MLYPKNKSFTLIELLVVIAIIGLLALIIISYLLKATQKAADARASESLYQIEIAARFDYDKYGNWAPDVGPGEQPRFVSPAESGYPISGWNAEYYCAACVYDWQNWCSGKCIMIDLWIYREEEEETAVRRRCIYCDPRCPTEYAECHNF